MGRGHRQPGSAVPARPALRRAPAPAHVPRVAQGLALDRESIFWPEPRRTPCTGRCEDYCRCTTITGIRFPDHFQMRDLVALYDPEDPLSAYALERALTKAMPWGNEAAFSFTAVGGYYGEELDGVYLEDGLANRMDAQAAAMAALPDSDSRIREALLAEYGTLLPELEQAAFEAVEVARARIHLGADAHAASRRQEDLRPYHGYRGILGVALERPDGSLRLVDGYHRVLATDHDPVEILIAIPGEGPAPVRQRMLPPRARSLSEAMRTPRRRAG